jgi:hypothetical protein
VGEPAHRHDARAPRRLARDRLPDHAARRRFYNGSYIALRIIEARAPATPYDSGADTSILVTSGVLFGK